MLIRTSVILCSNINILSVMWWVIFEPTVSVCSMSEKLWGVWEVELSTPRETSHSVFLHILKCDVWLTRWWIALSRNARFCRFVPIIYAVTQHSCFLHSEEAVEAEKQLPHSEMIHRRKHLTVIWFGQSFCFIIIWLWLRWVFSYEWFIKVCCQSSDTRAVRNGISLQEKHVVAFINLTKLIWL